MQAGKHKTVLAVAFEKQSEGNAQFALGSGKGASLGAGGAFAPFIRAYIQRSGAPEHIGWKVAVKDRLNALKNPYAHLKIEDISIEKVKESPMMWEPHPVPRVVPLLRRRLRGGPHRRGGRQGGRRRRPSAGVDPRAPRPAPSRPNFPGRDPVRPEACARSASTTSTPWPASPTPASRWTWPSCTCRSRGTRPIWLEGHRIAEPGEGWKMIDDGSTELAGSFPINASGGVLSSNPIGASGLLRFAEAANQVRGAAGEHQVEGPGPPSPWPTAPTASTSACGSWPTASSPFG